ncbi:DMT family transporter [Sciscionella sediminilitoris]|uniref:DMT family transporter n=1 Tax=Sciscionella sediminilitoris TaxID=1445613 RepID=UPI000ABBB033|nr:DMT family transporter [Sciscionella sp. SE31]
MGLSTLRSNPRALVIAGTVNISCSGMFIALAATTPAIATVFRCLLALPFLIPLALWEIRRIGFGRRWPAHLGAGALLGCDFVLWSQSIADIGAGISTVLVNVQVIVVPLLARLSGERIDRRFLVIAPVALTGVVLASGLTAPGEHTLRGSLCALGAGVCYSGYLVIMRRTAKDSGKFIPVTTATVATALVGLLAGTITGSFHLPGAASFGWLLVLAVTGQVLGWVLVGAGLPGLSSATGAVLLLLQPVLAVGWGALVLGERPGPVQLLGCAIVVAALWLSSRQPRKVRVSQPVEALAER